MAIAAEKLRVDVEADTSRARAEISQFDGQVGKAGRGFSALRGAAVAFAGSAVAAFAGKTIMAASDLNEELSKAGVVFGPAKDKVVRQANELANAFGLPKAEIIGAASSIGLVAKASGLGQRPAADMGNSLAKLAADASSFYNVPLAEALQAMQSGLVGEAEPMRRFGVLLSEAAVQQEAVRLGIAKTGAELTEGQKVQARYSLMTKGMSDASGDLARTQDSVANRLREIKGRAINAAAGLGTALLPAVSATLGGLIQFGGMVSDTVGKIKNWIETNPMVQVTLARISTEVGKFVGWVREMIPVVQAWMAEMGARLLPVLQQVAQWIMANVVPALQQIAQMIRTQVLPMAQQFAQWFMSRVVPAAMRIYEVVASNLMPIFQQLVATFRGSVLPTIQNLIQKFRDNQPAIQAVVEKVQTFVGKALELASAVASKVIPPLIRFAGFLLGNVVPAIAQVVIWAIKIIGKMFDIASAIIDAAAAGAEFAGKIISGIGRALTFIAGIPGKVKGALSDAGSWLLSAGADLVRGFIQGIKNMAGQAAEAAQNMAKAAVDKVTGFLKIGSPSKLLEQIGKWTGEGLINGLKGTADQVGATMDALLSKVDESLGKGQGAIGDKVAGIVNGVRGKLVALGTELTQTQDFFGQVYAQVMGMGGLSGLGARTDEAGQALGPTALTILEDLRSRVTQAADFATNLATLKARGLSQTAIAELTQAGADQAGAAAAALAGAGADVIAQVNSLQVDLGKSAANTARIGSAAMFDAGQNMAKAIAKGFQSQRSVILEQMEDIAEAMVRRLHKKLGIRSPARAGVYVGRMTGMGVQRGAEGTVRGLERTSDRMAQAILPTPQEGFRASRWQPGVVPSTAGSPSAPNSIGEVHFHDAHLSPAEQVEALDWAFATRGG